MFIYYYYITINYELALEPLRVLHTQPSQACKETPVKIRVWGSSRWTWLMCTMKNTSHRDLLPVHLRDSLFFQFQKRHSVRPHPRLRATFTHQQCTFLDIYNHVAITKKGLDFTRMTFKPWVRCTVSTSQHVNGDPYLFRPERHVKKTETAEEKQLFIFLLNGRLGFLQIQRKKNWSYIRIYFFLST